MNEINEDRENQPFKKQFSQLSNPEKILAILATQQAPQTKETIFRYVGINLENLNPDQIEEIDNTFSTDGVISKDKPPENIFERARMSPWNEGEVRYTLTDELKSSTQQSLDLLSIYIHIVDIDTEILKELGIDL